MPAFFMHNKSILDRVVSVEPEYVEHIKSILEFYVAKCQCWFNVGFCTVDNTIFIYLDNIVLKFFICIILCSNKIIKCKKGSKVCKSCNKKYDQSLRPPRLQFHNCILRPK